MTTQKDGGVRVLLESSELFLAWVLCTFPQEHEPSCKKRLFMNYLVLFVCYDFFTVLAPQQITYL